MNGPGRTCPTDYGYRPEDLLGDPPLESETTYVVGGLYGNVPALDAIERLASRDAGPVTIVFNGDFNWFNVDADSFREVNRRVLAHYATAGNVERELVRDDDAAGCGCAYPDSVDDATVARSDAIHSRLRRTAEGFPEVLAGLAALPRFRVLKVGKLRVGIVHGDAESIAGWRFDRESLDDPATRPWLERVFQTTGLDGFASSHTCLPVCRRFTVDGRLRFVVNNGAAGMPNFAGNRFGIMTRIGLNPSPRPGLYGLRVGDVHVDAIALAYDHALWITRFLGNWPVGSPGWDSYGSRLMAGPRYEIFQARP